MTILRSLTVVAVVLSLSCTDEGPVSGPGTLTATLVGPEGAGGAALLSLIGDGVDEVSPIGATEIHARRDGEVTRVVLLDQRGGVLAFQVAVTDTTQLPAVVIHQVAGIDDELRSVDQYTLEFGR